MIYRTEQANWAMIHATCLIWTKIKRGCGPSCETMAGVWKKALNATVPWGFCPLPARGYRASDRSCWCYSKQQKTIVWGTTGAKVDILPGDQPQIQRFIMVYHLPHVQNDSCSYTSDVT